MPQEAEEQDLVSVRSSLGAGKSSQSANSYSLTGIDSGRASGVAAQGPNARKLVVVDAVAIHMVTMNLRHGTVAVITGAAFGIGRALSYELAARGCSIALVDNDADGLQRVAAALSTARASCSVHAVDVADRLQMQALPDSVLQQHGSVHLLINNAGVSVAGPFESFRNSGIRRGPWC